MTYRELVRVAVEQMEEAGVPDAALDGRYLLEHVFGISREWYLSEGNCEILPEHERFLPVYRRMAEKRCRRVPLQYLTGVQEFMGLPFEVNPRVLIPRADTEHLVEAALSVAAPGDCVLDMCTGSGCVLISLLVLGKDLSGCGVDLSEEALAVARRNGRQNGVDARWIAGDLFENVSGRYNLLVSNPPYIPSGDIAGLMPEVRDFEPHLALDGHEDGLFFYRRMAGDAAGYLQPGGWLLFEIGYNQGDEVSELMKRMGFVDVEVRRDYSGHDRVVMGHL